MASPEENDSNLRSSRPRKLDSPFTEEDLLMRETEAEWEANLVFLEAESPFMHAFEQGRSTPVEPEELEGEFTEEEWTEDSFSVDEAETQVEEGLVDREDDDADLEDENPFYTEQEDNLFENRELLEEASPAEMRETATDFVPLPVEQPGGGRIRDKRDPPPGDLETIKGVGGKNIQLHRLAAAAWRALLAAARRDGIQEPLLLIVSGYRDTKKQAKLYQDAVKRYGSESEARKWVAPPGGSPHHSGRAIDFYLGDKNSSRNVESLRKKPAYLWLTKYARQFGFYPYEREPWHWEYNPPASGRLEGTAPAGKPSLPGSVVPVQPKQQSAAKPTAGLVLFAQRVLNAAEGERLGNDGSLGPLTSAALERFRKKYSLGTGSLLDESTVFALVQRALEELAQASMFARIGTRDARTEQAITTFKAAHQLGVDSRIDSATLRALTDALSRMAPRPASATMPQKSALAGPSTYLGGKLWTFEAKTLPTRVAVFCPPAALSKREVEVLVFAHGLLNGCRRPKSIPDGIITDAPFNLGNIVVASNRPIVLVVPYLDWASPGGERAFGRDFRKWHALGKPAHLNSIVAEVLAEAGRVQGITPPSLRNLVIAGHSRAYDFLEPLAYSRSDTQMQQGALSRLSQVWAFDSTYAGKVSNWMSWLDANPRLRVSIFYEPGSKTGKVGDEFFRIRGGRLAVIHAREGHCAVPARRLPELLKSLSFAEDHESEVDLSEAEFERYEADLEDEDFASEIDEGYASEMYNYETSYDVNVIDPEYDTEFEGESEKAFEPTEEYEVDFSDSLEELDAYEQSFPSEPELDSLAFDALGSHSEYTINEDNEELESEAANRSNKDYVSWVQSSLNAILGLNLSVDGIMGPQTSRAIRSFQQKNGLVADGVVGSKTEAALRAALGNIQKSPSKSGGRHPWTLERFDFAKSELRPEHYEKIQSIVDYVKASRNTSEPVHWIDIIGHTDLIGTDTNNYHLGCRRAWAATKELKKRLDRNLLLELNFRVASLGKKQPIKGDDAASRRVEISLHSVKPSNLPEGSILCNSKPNPGSKKGHLLVRVVRSDGKPPFNVVRGVPVSVRSNPEAGFSVPFSYDKTDGNGYKDIGLLDAGNYIVDIFCLDLAGEKTKQVTIKAGEKHTVIFNLYRNTPLPKREGCPWEDEVDWDNMFDKLFNFVCSSLVAAKMFCNFGTGFAGSTIAGIYKALGGKSPLTDFIIKKVGGKEFLPKICSMSNSELELLVDEYVIRQSLAEVTAKTGIIAGIGEHCPPPIVTERRYKQWKQGRKCF